MKLLSVKTILADGGRHTSAVKISDEDAMDEIAVQNAIAAIGGNVESFQIIDTDHGASDDAAGSMKVIETVGTGNEDDQTSDGPRVGIQHEDAVGIVDNQPSGSDPTDSEPHREDIGTLTGGDAVEGALASLADLEDTDTGKPRRKKLS